MKHTSFLCRIECKRKQFVFKVTSLHTNDFWRASDAGIFNINDFYLLLDFYSTENLNFHLKKKKLSLYFKKNIVILKFEFLI